MRPNAPTPTDDPLPQAVPGDTAPGLPKGMLLRDEDVARFDALLHELNPDAVGVDAERVQGLCAWLAGLPEAAAHDVLDRRLRRIEELRAMLDDIAWDATAGLRDRIRKLVAYVDQDDDLIPDRQPLVGQLDDVLMIELSWPAFAAEADDYRDFSAYRDETHPAGSGDEQRAAWIRDRLAELALWRHNARVNDSHYAWAGHPTRPFQVGG